MVKESFNLKQFYCVNESAMYYNKDYPPFFTMVELFWCFVRNAYQERLCFMALNFAELSMFVPLFESKIETKKPLIIALLLGIGIAVGYSIGYTYSLCYNTFFYNCIYIDWPLAYLLGFLFVYIFYRKNDNWDYLFMTIGLSSLIMTKQISLAFVLLITTYLLVDKVLNKHIRKKNIFLFIVMIIIPLLLSYSWSSLISSYGIESKFNVSEINFLFPVDYFKGTLDYLQPETVDNFVNALFHNGIISWPIKISYAAFMVVIPLLITLADYDNLKKSLTIAIMYLGGGLGYAYAMLLSYIYLFGYSEGPTITMFDRYMLIYVLAGFFILYSLFAPKVKDSYKNVIIMGVVVCAFIRPGTIMVSQPQLQHDSQYDEVFSMIEKYDSMIEDDEKVLVISQRSPEKRAAIRYYLSDNEGKYTFVDLTYAADNNYDDGVPTWDDEYQEMLWEYDYIFISDYDETFYNHFWYADFTILENHYYKINKENLYDIYFERID